MSDVSKTNAELIAEARKLLADFGGGYQDYAGGSTRHYMGFDLVERLAAALESATRVPEQGEASAAIERVRAIHQREVIAVHPGVGEEAWCPACQEHWPCSTATALDGAPEPEVTP